MTLDWAPTSDTAWAARDARYTYRIAASSPSPFEGYIYRHGGSEMVFSWTYRSLAEAMADLASRGEREYFVRPDDPTPVVPAEATPPAEKATPVVVDEADTLIRIPPEGDWVAANKPGAGHTIETYVDAAGEYRWRRKAANHEPISGSLEGYTRREKMEHGLRLANQDPHNYTIVDLTEETR